LMPLGRRRRQLSKRDVLRDSDARRVFALRLFGLDQLFPSLGVEGELIQALAQIHALHLREGLEERTHDRLDESLWCRQRETEVKREHRVRETDRDRERQTETERDREGETESERERQRETERERQRERETERETETETERQRVRDRERQRGREREKGYQLEFRLGHGVVAVEGVGDRHSEDPFLVAL
jgi:hypothetical protein